MMAAMASLQSKISSLEKKLRAENDEQNLDKKLQRELGMVPSSPRPRAQRPNLVNMNHLSKSPSSAAKRKITMDLPGSPVHRFHERQDNLLSAEIDKKMQEIMKLTGILTIDSQKYQTDIKDLHALGELGNGTCGHVVKMLHTPSKKIIAVKQMRRSGNEEESKRIIMDLEVVLKSHDCPYIVRCLGCFITDTDVWICMEHMATCLDKLLKRLRSPIPEKIIGKMAVAILNALNYLKEMHGVIHRDVKPSNILLDEKGTVKLCDFGISGRLVDSKAKTRGAGCAAYMAPERIIPPDPRKPDYDIRADVWSLGITLVELATGRFPYVDCKTDFEVLTKILESDPPLLPPSQGFSIDFCSFVKDCLTKDCKSRPKYKKLLQHNFIRRYETLNVDVASWFAQVMRQTEMSRTNN